MDGENPIEGIVISRESLARNPPRRPRGDHAGEIRQLADLTPPTPGTHQRFELDMCTSSGTNSNVRVSDEAERAGKVWSKRLTQPKRADFTVVKNSLIQSSVIAECSS